MYTALSWTELRSSRQDLGSLLEFRSSGLTRAARRRMRVGGLTALTLTGVAAIGPAYLGGPFPRVNSGQLIALLPSLCLGFFLLVAFTAVASAGGREIVPREQAVVFPISTTAEHFGALILAPLNIAWLAQVLRARTRADVGLRAAGRGVDPGRDGACAGGRLDR